jgi:hypothetical protein
MEAGSLEIILVKMRSQWIRMGHNLKTAVSKRRRKFWWALTTKECHRETSRE